MTAAYRVEKNVEIPVRDGTVLRADVRRLDDGRAHPVLLQRTPYQKELTASGAGFEDVLCLDMGVMTGYTVVIQDSRGMFASDGEWAGLTDAAWATEATDTYDSVEWIARQAWCDGGVALLGRSYAGALCWLGARERPPHLRAIVPMMIGSRDLEHLDTGGGFWLHTWVTWYLGRLAARVPQLMAVGSLSPEDARKILATADDPARILEHLPLQDSPHFDLPGMPLRLYDVLRSGSVGPPKSFDIHRVAVPALLIAGWFDFYLAQTFEQFRQLRTTSSGGTQVRRSHRLIIGPWQHGRATKDQGEVDFGPSANGTGQLQAAVLSFLDQHLRGGTDDQPAVRYFHMGSNLWRATDRWPPAGQREIWYLHSNGSAHTPSSPGALTRRPPTVDENPDRFRYDPANPVRTLGGRVFGSLPGIGVGGPRDQSRVAVRNDVLCYLSAPLIEAVEIIGEAHVHLYAASNVTDTDFVAKVVDVHPDGWAVLVASGFMRARFRKGIDHELPLQAGAIEEYTINVGPLAYRVCSGHRLGVYICSSDFPWYDRNMNTGNPIGVDATPIVAEQTVLHTATHPSRLEIDLARPDVP